MAFTSCTDMGGDGIGETIWEGSTNPENTQFRNPVWEPSLEAGSIVRGSSMYAAISATTQWAPGLTFYCPALASNNLVEWSRANSDAFDLATTPIWQAFGEEETEAEAEYRKTAPRVNSLSVDFAKTIANANYWLFYTLEGQNGIGAAQAASTPQGPYADQGQITLKTTTQTVKDPFFIVVSTNFYLCYSTEEGVYIQKMTLKRNATPTCSGSPTLIAGPEFTDVAIYRNSASDVYLFGTVNGEIRYARAANITGPYLDKAGNDLTAGSNGELLIAKNAEYSAVENPMRAFINPDAPTHMFLFYNAVEAKTPTMQSGYARKPVFVQPMEMTEDGWFNQTYSPKKGWTAPRYE